MKENKWHFGSPAVSGSVKFLTVKSYGELKTCNGILIIILTKFKTIFDLPLFVHHVNSFMVSSYIDVHVPG